MSETGAPAPATETTTQKILDALNNALPIVAAIVSALAPEASAAAAIGVKVAQGVIAGVPEAEALWAQFQSGAIPTQAQLDAYAVAENAAYEQVMADIAAKLLAAPQP